MTKKHTLPKDLQKAIQDILQNRKIDEDFFKSRSLSEITEEIAVYHQELEYQNQELLRNQEILRKTRDQLQDLFDNAPLGYVLFNQDGDIVKTNHSFERMVQEDPRDLLGMRIQQIILPEYQDVFYLHIRNLLKNQRTSSVQIKINEKNPLAVKIESNLQQEEEGLLIRTALLDITTEKEYEEELENARRQADAANLSKSRFLANVSHELRTPINGINGFVQLLEMTPLNKEQEEYTGIIKKSTGSLLRLINEILDLARIEAGKTNLEHVIFDLPVTLNETLQLFERDMKEKGLDMTSYIGVDVPRKVKGDPFRLKQILGNLLSNALKFTDHGSIIVSVTLEKMTRKNAMVLFTVKDTGIGIPKEKISQLFQPFTQVDSSSSRKYGGSGLGLVISKNLVELMGGEIRMDSEEGTGTRVSFTINFCIPE